MNHNPAFDASIPVLTEVFQEPPAKEAALAAVEALAQVAGDAAVSGEPAVENLGEPQWADLERRLSERILTQLHEQLDGVLEQHVRETLEVVLQNAIAGLTDDIRSGLQQTIETIVTRAVGAELAQRQTLQK